MVRAPFIEGFRVCVMSAADVRGSGGQSPARGFSPRDLRRWRWGAFMGRSPLTCVMSAADVRGSGGQSPARGFPPPRLAVVSWGAFMVRFASALCLRQTSGKTLPEGGSRVGSEGHGRRSMREWRLVGSSEARQMGAVAARPPCLRQTSSQRCSYRCQ